MSYAQKTLLPDENILHLTKPHYIIFSQALIWLFFAMLAHKFNFGFLIYSMSLLMGCFVFSGNLISYFCSEYVITNKRIVMKVGFIRRRSLEIFLDRVEGVYIDQSIFGRILNYGTVIIVGVGGTKNPFYYIPQPLKFRSMVQERLVQKSPGVV